MRLAIGSIGRSLGAASGATADDATDVGNGLASIDSIGRLVRELKGGESAASRVEAARSLY